MISWYWNKYGRLGKWLTRLLYTQKIPGPNPGLPIMENYHNNRLYKRVIIDVKWDVNDCLITEIIPVLQKNSKGILDARLEIEKVYCYSDEPDIAVSIVGYQLRSPEELVAHDIETKQKEEEQKTIQIRHLEALAKQLGKKIS